MYSVSEKTKKLYLNELDDYEYTPVYKIIFPDDDLPEITGQNIMQGTPELEQSLWEGSSMQLGGCISSTYRMTLAETEEDKECGITEWNWSPLMKGKHIRVLAGYEETEVNCIYDGYIKEAERQEIRNNIEITCYDAMTVKFDVDVSKIYNSVFTQKDSYKGAWKEGVAYKSGDVVFDESDENYYVYFNTYENLRASYKTLEHVVANIVKEHSPSELSSETGISWSDVMLTEIPVEWSYGSDRYEAKIVVADIVICLGKGTSWAYNQVSCENLLKAVQKHCGFTGSILLPEEVASWALCKTMESTELSGRGCIAQIAEAFGCCALINREGNIEFRKLQISQNVQTISDYEKLTYSDFVLTPIDGVCIKDETGETRGYPDEKSGHKNMYTIADNFMFYSTQNNRTVEKIYEGIQGFSYRAFQLGTLGMPWLEVGDTVKFTTESGLEITTIIQSRTLKGTTSSFSDTFKAECSDAACNDNNTSSYSSASQIQGSVNYYVNEELKKRLKFEDLEAENAKLGYVTAEEFSAKVAEIDDLTANSSIIKSIFSESIIGDSAVLKVLQSNVVDADTVKAVVQEVGYLTADEAALKYADISLTNIKDGTIKNAMIGKAEIDFENVNTSFVHDLTADKGYIADIASMIGSFGYITADEADLKYANIKFTNIDKTNIGIFFAGVGLLDRATIVDGHVTGFLDSVEVNAANITAGTLIADRILLRGSEDGLLFALNNMGELVSQNTDTLDGHVLADRTVNADKLVSHSVTSNEIDVENLFAQAITATDMHITGDSVFDGILTAPEGTIGGYTIGQKNLISTLNNGDYAYTVLLNNDPKTVPFNETDEDLGTVAIEVRTDKKGTTKGGWYVTYDGFMYAEKGKVGGYDLTDKSFSAEGTIIDDSGTEISTMLSINSPSYEDTEKLIDVYIEKKYSNGSSSYGSFFSIDRYGHSFADNITAGNMQINNGKLTLAEAASGSEIRAWLDNEGANLRFTSKDGISYEMDTLNNGFRLYTFGDDSTYRRLFNVDNGELNINGSSASALFLKKKFSSRQTSANMSPDGNGGLFAFQATSSMTTGKPSMGDSNIIHQAWDNTGGWDTQIAVRANQPATMQLRGMSNGTWGDWHTVLDTYNSRSVVLAGKTANFAIKTEPVGASNYMNYRHPIFIWQPQTGLWLLNAFYNKTPRYSLIVSTVPTGTDPSSPHVDSYEYDSLQNFSITFGSETVVIHDPEDCAVSI